MSRCGLRTCRKRLRPEQGFKTPLMNFCNREHASEYWRALQEGARVKLRAKAKAKRKTADRAALLALNRRTKSWQHNLCRPVFNRMRVLEELLWFKERDLEPTCISCNRPNMDFCCGHMKSVGAQSGLRYSEVNTYLQCNRYCNSSLSANIEGNKTTRGYKQGLRERFGEQEGNTIINYCETHTDPGEWTCEELQAMRKDWNKEILKLEALLQQ